MKNKIQLSLLPQEKTKWSHGGGKVKGNAREARPFARKRWIHVCLKSSKAKGHLSFLAPHNEKFIRALLKKTQKKFMVQVHDFANVGNHLHLKLRATQKINFQNFLRVLTTQLARFVTGARKGKPFGMFWGRTCVFESA